MTKKTGSLRHRILNFCRRSVRWFVDTPERALIDAYQAATRIKQIETEHFGGKKISFESVSYSDSVINYWQAELNNNLNIINIRLAEFRLSRALIKISNQEILKKLKYIDAVVVKYLQEDEKTTSQPIIDNTNTVLKVEHQDTSQQKTQDADVEKMRVKPVTHKTGILPGSIGRTFNQIKEDFAPKAEEKYVQKFRISRKRSQAALRFLILLTVVPLLVNSMTKNFLVSPIVESIRSENTQNIQNIFLNSNMEDDALQQLRIYEQGLKFENLIMMTAPSLTSDTTIQQKVKEKAIELAEEFRHKSTNSISNVFADIFSLIAFAIVIATSKRDIAILKAFLDNLVYGLSDSAKAFLIILFTDIFVGFHSPHGWEILLEGITEHLGLPATRSAIFLFIATFPVVLDTIFKYWIFRYLSRLSPSALATLKEMNE
ncbi:MAG: proton extrusion protein PcxA [Calothrix sp. C42_A2020_038]|nr:proton extrusion protein PcxA [Calothrix sp. C42_A2020_038]